MKLIPGKFFGPSFFKRAVEKCPTCDDHLLPPVPDAETPEEHQAFCISCGQHYDVQTNEEDELGD